ncbi:GNAT family N-acetyltransferase [Eubacteriales bacterium OttesenSCG-928-M02]|nr:GNAT family N-acetyltransferase [Eubacteriales bacterium OttesenSCG-928-M02]
MGTAKPSDRTELAALWAACFDDTQRYIDYFFDTRFAPENTFITRVDNRIVAALYVIPYVVDIRGEGVNSAFLVGVATHPDERKKGYSKALIKEALLACKDRGYRYSHLYPFLHAFYRNLGYETVTNRLLVSYDTKALQEAYPIAGYQTKDICPADGKTLLSLYDAFMAARTGHVIRADMNPLLQEHLLDGHGVLLQRNGVPVGYALYYTGTDGLMAEEFVYLDQDARKELLAFLCRETMERVLKVGYPYYEPMAGEKGVISIAREEYGMGRIISLDGLEVPTQYPGKKTLLLQVEDDYLPENRGVYRITAKGGMVSFAKTTEPLLDGEMVCGIGELMAAISGCLSIRNTNNYTALPPLTKWWGRLLDFFPTTYPYLFEKY